MTGAERFLAACRREPVDATPVWFMRQAGSALARYRALRERHDVATIAATPELAAEVSAMPVADLDVDAAILFADIMLPLRPMGVDLALTPEGPVLARPLRRPGDVAALRPVHPPDDLAFVGRSIALLRERLDEGAAVIGIAGGPFTLACYLVEGEASRDFHRARAFAHAEPAAWRDLMERLTAVTIEYLRWQVRSGAQAVQVFDSWVGVLSGADYEALVAPWMRRVLRAVPEVPVIHFAASAPALLERLAATGGDVIGLDWRASLREAWRRVPDRAVQGNLDPARVLAGWDAAREGADAVLAEAHGRPGHVFNLGHAIPLGTDEAVLARLVARVHERTARAPDRLEVHA
jgi:uroporphyrinogen decarboxylase